MTFKNKLNKTIGMQVIRANSNKLCSVLTDDLDSLIACKYLKEKYGIPIGAFYDKTALYQSCFISNDRYKVYVDCDLHCGGIALGNHYTPTNNNELSVNPNMFLRHDGSSKDYYKKYAGSTTTMLYAMDGIENLERKQLEYLILADGWYKQLYTYHTSGQFYIEQLEIPQIATLRDEHDINYWENLIKQYNTYKKIIIERSNPKQFCYLKWQNGIDTDLFQERFGFDISLPTERFYITETFTKYRNEDIDILKTIPAKKIRSIVESRYNKISFSRSDNLETWRTKTGYTLIYIGGDDDENN